MGARKPMAMPWVVFSNDAMFLGPINSLESKSEAKKAPMMKCRPAPSVSFGIQMLAGGNLQADIEQADQAMYEHKALRSDGVNGLTNHRSMHGV